MFHVTDHDCFSDNGTLFPVKELKPLPDGMLVVCRGGGKCENLRCLCAKAGLPCVLFWHDSHESECRNK